MPTAARYHALCRTWGTALARRRARGLPVHTVAALAGFPLVALDALADQWLAEHAGCAPFASALRGRVALAAARLAYQRYRHLAGHGPWRALQDAGARLPRPAWAPADQRQADALVGPDTVQLLSARTLAAYREQGRPAPRLTQHLAEAIDTLRLARAAWMDLEALAARLAVAEAAGGTPQEAG